MSSELWQLTATEQLDLVATRQVSCLELVDAHLTRIEKVNPHVNAITTVLSRSARIAAAAADQSGAAGPLRGLPFTVKSDIDCLGSATSHGVAALRDALPYADAPAVARLRAAGGILIGRTNVSEMGLRLCADSPLYGRTLNPHDPTLTAGGSSCGDAVAVATGMVALGIGGDFGGSLRVPAACSGCVTLKPTVGRVPHASSLPPRDHGLAMQLMLAIGPMVRSALDLGRVLPILAGRDVRDPRSVDAPLRSPETYDRVVGVVTSLPGQPLPAAAVGALERAASMLETAGWEVEEVVPPDLALVEELFANLLASEIRALEAELEPIISSALGAHLHRLAAMDQARPLSAAKLHVERARLIREWSQLFAGYPVLLGPTLGVPIWPVDADLDADNGLKLLRDATRFTVAGSVLGIPSLALPMPALEDVPSSVLLYADLWQEERCIEAAIAIERCLPRLPPVEPRVRSLPNSGLQQTRPSPPPSRPPGSRS